MSNNPRSELCVMCGDNEPDFNDDLCTNCASITEEFAFPILIKQAREMDSRIKALETALKLALELLHEDMPVFKRDGVYMPHIALAEGVISDALGGDA